VPERHLHIISFIVPYPVTYGGVFDIYYKIVALHKAGIKIILHCFTENKKVASELEKYCNHIYYYQRKKGIRGLSLRLPYIVSSRMSPELHENLSNDSYPVLIEGIHAAGWLFNNAGNNRTIVLRLHNVEHDYYEQLYQSSSSIMNKIYYRAESLMLKKFESKISRLPSSIVAVSGRDALLYKQKFGISNVHVLPVFTGFSHDAPPAGSGTFCLYHGNLSVPENEKAVIWLLKQVFNGLDMDFVIAGMKPSPQLVRLASLYKNVRLVINPDSSHLHKLIATAQCHVLPSFNITGVKLKLINALFHGRHCIVNSAAVQGSGLENICHIAESAEQLRETVLRLYYLPITDEEIFARKNVLNTLFDEDKNCKQLIRWIW
jgi:hypothetical protein